MKAFALICTLILLIAVAVLSSRRTPPMPAKTTPATELSLTSRAFPDGGPIPAVYTCEGKNINPPLSISGVPAKTVSLVLFLEDPDAPMGTWNHWVVYNIPPTVKSIGEDEEPEGTPGKGSNGKIGYAGPCPPSGTHHYVFSLYAVDAMLPDRSGMTKDEVESAMHDHMIGMAKLTGTYNVKS